MSEIMKLLWRRERRDTETERVRGRQVERGERGSRCECVCDWVHVLIHLIHFLKSVCVVYISFDKELRNMIFPISIWLLFRKKMFLYWQHLYVWQRVCRGYLVRQWVQKRMLAIVQMQAAVRTVAAQKKLRRMRIEVSHSKVVWGIFMWFTIKVTH